MIVRIARVKVGNRQAPLQHQKPHPTKVGFLRLRHFPGSNAHSAIGTVFSTQRPSCATPQPNNDTVHRRSKFTHFVRRHATPIRSKTTSDITAVVSSIAAVCRKSAADAIVTMVDTLTDTSVDARTAAALVDNPSHIGSSAGISIKPAPCAPAIRKA